MRFQSYQGSLSSICFGDFDSILFSMQFMYDIGTVEFMEGATFGCTSVIVALNGTAPYLLHNLDYEMKP